MFGLGAPATLLRTSSGFGGLSSIPIMAVAGLGLVAFIAMSAASCQTRLLEAGSAEGRLAVRSAIDEDNLAVAEKERERHKLAMRLENAARAEQEKLAVHWRGVAEDAKAKAAEEKEPLACPTEDEWLHLLRCSPPRF